MVGWFKSKTRGGRFNAQLDSRYDEPMSQERKFKVRTNQYCSSAMQLYTVIGTMSHEMFGERCQSIPFFLLFPSAQDERRLNLILAGFIQDDPENVLLKTAVLMIIQDI